MGIADALSFYAAARQKESDIDYYVIHHDSAHDEFEPGPGDKTEERAECGLQGIPGSLAGIVKFSKECPEERAEYHPHRWNHEKSEYQPRHSPALSGLGPAGQPCEIQRDNIVNDADGNGNAEHHKQKCKGHVFPGPVSPAPEIEQEHPDPCERRPRKSGQYAAEDPDHPCENCQYSYEYFHITTFYFIIKGRVKPKHLPGDRQVLRLEVQNEKAG